MFRLITNQHTQSKDCVFHISMELQPPDLLDRFYPSLDELVTALNAFASLQGYAIVKRRTNTSKKGVLRKAVLMCDRGKEHIDKNGSKRDTTSRKTDCPFDAIAILEQEEWSYRLRNGDHNHDPTLAGAHPAHRKITQTEDVLDQTANHTKTGASPQQTLTHLRLGQNPENPLIKNRDIYKERQGIREHNLDRLTPIQALMRTLFNTKSWFVIFHIQDQFNAYFLLLDYLNGS